MTKAVIDQMHKLLDDTYIIVTSKPVRPLANRSIGYAGGVLFVAPKIHSITSIGDVKTPSHEASRLHQVYFCHSTGISFLVSAVYGHNSSNQCREISRYKNDQLFTD